MTAYTPEGIAFENIARMTVDEIPVLNVKFPRPLTSIHQIEVSSHCNLRCSYCPSAHLGRPKLNMTRETFERALVWVDRFVKAGTQRALNLAGIGESTLNPHFPAFVARAREVIGWDKQLIFATNGIGYGQELVDAVAPFKPDVWVSLHRPEKAGITMELWRKAGVLKGVSADPAINANDWAGQVEWKNTTNVAMPCIWLRQGMAMVMADGRLTACCIDASGAGVIGHVDDSGSDYTEPYSLCATCHQEIRVEGYEQRAGRLPVLKETTP